MLFKRTLQRESDLSSRTITIEDGSSSCKYMVIVYTAQSQPLSAIYQLRCSSGD